MAVAGNYYYYGLVAVVVLFLSLAACEGWVKPPAGPDPYRHRNMAHDARGQGEVIFNVLNYGAKPDGKTDNFGSFMKTWNAACHSKGAARVYVPQATFVTSQVAFDGPCTCTGPIIFQIDGTIKATTDVSEYVSDDWILFERIQGLIVTGRGTLDGQGDAVWKYNNCGSDAFCQKLPVSLKLDNVMHAIIKGITSVNSKGFHMHITNSDNIRVRRVHLIAPEESPNTDGIHLSRSNNVKIARTVIRTGDDCVSIGQGSVNVTINKVTCGPGHGFSVGSLGKYEDEQDVRGVIVRSCTLSKTQNGLRIKTWPNSPPSAASSIFFQDIIMDNVKNPILIDQEYNCRSPCKKAPSRVRISDVHFLNIRGTTTSPVAVNLKCSQQFPCSNVGFINVNLKYAGLPNLALPFSSSCNNARVGYRGIQSPPPCN